MINGMKQSGYGTLRLVDKGLSQFGVMLDIW